MFIVKTIRMPLRIGLKNLVSLSTFTLAALLPCMASATLGEQEASVQADSQLLQGSIKESDRAGFRVHEIQLPSGTLVREYTGLDGNVFAVTWRGPFMPNLRQTLGRYFDAYATASKAKHADHNHWQVQQSDLVVQAGGHMRAFSGRAYLPQAIPGGVSVEDIQ
jgi:hypothetical protein